MVHLVEVIINRRFVPVFTLVRTAKVFSSLFVTNIPYNIAYVE